MKKLLRIGQVCNLYGISLDTLRYYDRKGILKPIVDEQSGYRYYSLEHLDVLEMILVGKYLEIPLDQMKKKIEFENIDGYISMLEDQSKFIKEKLAIFRKLSQYTNEMSTLLKSIKSFDNDYTFSKVSTEEKMDITIYNVDLKNFLNNDENSQIDGIEAFEQWFSYCVDDKGIITENSETVGLSIHSHLFHANELSRYLDCMVDEGKMSRHHISGNFRHISFWGNEKDLRSYLDLLCCHFNLRDSVLNIKFCFSLLHKDMKHEYFAEIYFSE